MRGLTPVVTLLLALSGVLLSSACGDGSGEAKPGKGSELTTVLATSDLAVGKQRLTFVVLDDDVPVTDKPAFVRFFKNADSSPRVVGQGSIPWAAIGAQEEKHDAAGHDETELTGIYYVNAEFDEPGTWGIGVTLGDKLDEKTEMRILFTVKPKSEAPSVGERAVPVNNPVASEKPLKQIHTGPDSDLQFHSASIATAISSGRPSVIAFATPSFCRTRTCGPALQVAIKAQQKFGNRVNFVHVEPYELDAEGNMAKDGQGNQFLMVEAGKSWRLPTEPWVFVVDQSGAVVARFEGPYTLEELDYTLAQLTGR
ncbi:MAG: hypothetical protein C0506_13295 [Anaerolinea sp.]|nr:hypothetical protein [Anaerolinea sp.]